jgi:hypothetical protein
MRVVVVLVAFGKLLERFIILQGWSADLSVKKKLGLKGTT